jgi:hypothetical protein
MPKNYPAFIIDRSRRRTAARFTDDFVVCTDKEVGFIARGYLLPKSRRDAHIAALQADGKTFITKTFEDSTTVVLEVVVYLHTPLAHPNRVPPLLKKALRAYIFGEMEAGGGYDEQIAAIDDVLRTALSQRERMVDAQGEAGTERFINALRAARGTVALMQKITKSE